VRTFGGARSPVLVIQSQCDRPEDERDPPLPPSALDGFGYKKVMHYSAKGDETHARGHAALEETLFDAVQWMRGNQGVAKIGPGRAAVKEALEAKLAAGQRLISHQGYLDLCAEIGRTRKGRVSDPALLLDYLHNIGTVFYRKGLFGDRIILDQAWALDAVYAVFDRASQGFKKIERNHGRRRHDAATGAPVRNRCRRGRYRPGRPRRGDDAAIVTMGLRSVRRAGGHRHNRQRRSGLPHALPEVGDCASRQAAESRRWRLHLGLGLGLPLGAAELRQPDAQLGQLRRRQSGDFLFDLIERHRQKVALQINA
jgi:hypothetical protein